MIEGDKDKLEHVYPLNIYTCILFDVLTFTGMITRGFEVSLRNDPKYIFNSTGIVHIVGQKYFGS